jgi:hypothetical protein
MVTKRRQYRCIHDYDVLLENYIKLKTYMPTKFGKENTGLAKKYHIQQPYIVADKQLHSIVTGSNFEVSTIPNVRPLALLIPLGARNTKARPSLYQDYLCGGSQLTGSLITCQLNHSEVNAAARQPDMKRH